MASLGQKALLSPSKRFQESCVRNQGQRPNIRTKDALVLLSLKKFQGFQELCARNRGQRPIYIFYYRDTSEIIAGPVPDHCNKVNMAIKSHKFFGLPVHRKVMFTLHCSQKVCNRVMSKKIYIP